MSIFDRLQIAAAAILFPCILSSAAWAQSPAGIEWTNAVNATASGTTIQKSGGCNGCGDAGATSGQVLSAPDGYVEFTPTFGGRILAGLGATASTSTDPALIDYGISLWPDGGWDIRERSIYRAEGRFAAGDVFRIAVQGGVVRYFKNGAVVYTSTVAPSEPLVADVTLFSAGASLTDATITTGASAPPPAPPSSSTTAASAYEAITDREPRAKPALVDLGAAGFTFHDPAFGTRMRRITDGNSRPAALNRSYRTPSATHSNAWSADGRHFYTVSTDGTIIPFAFDPDTMTASRLEPSSSGDGGRTLRFFAEPTFSYVRPGVLYGTYNGPGSNLRSVDEYDIRTGQYTTLLNLDTLVADLAGTYIGGLLNAGGAAERLIAFFGGTSQDRHMYLVVFDRGDASKRRLVDTLASSVDGVPSNITLNFRIHAAAIDRSGRYVTIYPTGQDLQAPRSAAPAYVWDVETNTFTATPLAQARSGGHDAYGYGVRVNQDCCTASTWDAAQWQFRSLATPLVTADLVTVLTPKSIYLADHPSWHNAQPDRLVPFLDATYRYGANTTEWRAWDDEIIAVQTEAPGSGGTVWRFAHHRSNVANDLDPSRIGFWYTPRVNVSPDGRWALFTSNWEKSLGIDPKGDTSAAARQDLFLVELRQSAGSTPAPEPPPEPAPDPEPEPEPLPAPVVLDTAALPDAVRGTPYYTRLQASGGTNSYAWSLAAGGLPKGLSLDAATGEIAGTPQDQGMFKFTVQVSDATGVSAQRGLSLKVNRK